MLFGGVIIAGFLGLWPIALVMTDFHPLRYWGEASTLSLEIR
jgi:hypothetical protein